MTTTKTTTTTSTTALTFKTNAALVSQILKLFDKAEAARLKFESATAAVAKAFTDAVAAGVSLSDLKADVKAVWVSQGVADDTAKKRLRYVTNYMTNGTARGEAQQAHDQKKADVVAEAKAIVAKAKEAESTALPPAFAEAARPDVLVEAPTLTVDEAGRFFLSCFPTLKAAQSYLASLAKAQ